MLEGDGVSEVLCNVLRDSIAAGVVRNAFSDCQTWYMRRVRYLRRSLSERRTVNRDFGQSYRLHSVQ